MRIIQPTQISRMERSIKQIGQQQDIVLRQVNENHYQLIDGFKRYYAFEYLNKHDIYAQLVDVGELLATAIIITYNRESDTLNQLEESLVVKSLSADHLMSRYEMAKLLGYSRSWVCRRLSLVEKLDENVQSQIKLGVLCSSHGRELFRLPRGNQKDVMKTIVNNNLTTLQSRELISKYMKSGSQEKLKHILAEPLKVIS